jgi:DNA-binding transcriptional regulator of glucitol operon
MHVPINVKSRNNISKWQMGFNSTFKGLKRKVGIVSGVCKQQLCLTTVESFVVRLTGQEERKEGKVGAY